MKVELQLLKFKNFKALSSALFYMGLFNLFDCQVNFCPLHVRLNALFITFHKLFSNASNALYMSDLIA